MLLARKLGSAYAPFVICRVLYLHAVSISCLSDAVFNSGLKVLQLLATFLALHPGLAAHQGLLKHFSALLLASQYSSPPRRQIVHRPTVYPTASCAGAWPASQLLSKPSNNICFAEQHLCLFTKPRLCKGKIHWYWRHSKLSSILCSGETG